MNIINTLKKEIEKGNTLVDEKGNIISAEKLEKMLTREYIAGIRSGEFGGKSLEEHTADIADSMLTTSEILEFIIEAGDVEDTNSFESDYVGE